MTTNTRVAIDAKRLVEIRARADAASRGWQTCTEHENCSAVTSSDSPGAVCMNVMRREDGVFIAAARPDVPDLLNDLQMAIDILAELEWSAWHPTLGRGSVCPDCDGDDAHRPGCRLEALIDGKAAEREDPPWGKRRRT